VCDATSELVYSIIRDVSIWPELFEPCVATAVIDETASTQVVRVEALQKGQRVSWDSRRRYRDEIRRIDYQLIVPMPFVEAMSGEWRVVPLDGDRCLLTVDRWWRILADVSGIREGVDTVPQAAAFVSEYVNRNAGAEMDSIRAFVVGQADSDTERLGGSVLLEHSIGGVR
jgi:aromatase